MLTTSKSVTLSGTSKVATDAGEMIVVNMNANISENGTSNTNSVILNKEHYEANKAECRKDMDDFTAMVREIEDEQDAE